MILNDVQKEIKEMTARFADSELVPFASVYDREAHFSPDLYSKLAENGFFGIFIPEEFGGAGFDYINYALIVEEISRGCASTGVLVSAHNSLCVWPILNFGNIEQKKKYLPLLASGKAIGCFCLSEPNAGSDAGSLKTYAEDKGDFFEISGLKNYITNGKEASIG
ncbi:MAG: acyl-CoA dehydrogenase family protein, partial [Bacteriovoracaceae bacterium]|nr:acyl-CoA dehydrogenase family protein [Bacteriovoracaceae bacterium]